MLEHDRTKSPVCITETEILSAIRYLDPDLGPERTQRDASEMCGVVILLTTIVGVVTYICLHFGML
jgi:hypothetical protein